MKAFRAAPPGLVAHARGRGWGVYLGRGGQGGVGRFLFPDAIRLLAEAYPKTKTNGVGIAGSNLASLIPTGKKAEEYSKAIGLKVPVYQAQPPLVTNFRPYMEEMKGADVAGFYQITGQDPSTLVQAIIQIHKPGYLFANWHGALLAVAICVLAVAANVHGSRILPYWQNPVFEGSLAHKFDCILAADVVYHPDHARWIKACVEHLLATDGLFWLIIPLRPTGRHEGMSDTVDAIFPHEPSGKGDVQELVILGMEEMKKQDGVGRADEGGYKLYKIGWA